MYRNGCIIRLDCPHGTKYQMMKIRIETMTFKESHTLSRKPFMFTFREMGTFV